MYKVSKNIIRSYMQILHSYFDITTQGHFFPQNLGKKMSKFWVKKCTRCQKTSSGPICRYYIAILKSSLRDTFFPKIWGKKCPNLGKKTCKLSKNINRSYMQILHCYFDIITQGHFFTQNLGEKMSTIWGKKRVNCQKTSLGPTCRYCIDILISSLRDTFLPQIWEKKCPKFG